MADTTTKPGYKTTEFWLTLVAMLAGHAQAYELGGTLGSVVAVVVTVLGAFGYTAARAHTKAMEAKADAKKKAE